MRIEIRDRRNGFLWISNSFFDDFAREIHGSGLLVYLCLARMANNDTQECFPSYEMLAEKTGLSRSGVAESLKELQRLRLIEWEKKGRHNVYFLLEPNSPKSGLVQNIPSNSPVLTTEQSSGVDSNKTHNKTQEQEQTFPSPLAPERFVLDPNPPSLKKKSSKADPRHRQFMELIFKAHKHFTKIEPIMGPVVGNKLKVLLKSAPKLDEKGFRAMLTNYHESENHNPADSPAFYVHKLPNYVAGPLNKWGRPSEAS